MQGIQLCFPHRRIREARPTRYIARGGTRPCAAIVVPTSQCALLLQCALSGIKFFDQHYFTSESLFSPLSLADRTGELVCQERS